MKVLGGALVVSAIVASLSCGVGMAGDLSALRQWTGKYPFDEIVAGKSSGISRAYWRPCAPPWAKILRALAQENAWPGRSGRR